MPKDVCIAAENEEVWFPHPANPCNLYFRVKVADGVLIVIGADNAFGPSIVTVDRQSTNAVLLTMPEPPRIDRDDVNRLRAMLAGRPHLFAPVTGPFTDCFLCGKAKTDPVHLEGGPRHA